MENMNNTEQIIAAIIYCMHKSTNGLLLNKVE